MDFLNPKKERRNRIVLLAGYMVIAVGIGATTLLLLLQAFGYNLTRNGDVTLSGLVFVSSQPTGANIYLNGKLYKSQTNARMLLQAGSYDMKLTAPGYRSWERPITVLGSDLQRFDYPLLFPGHLVTTQVTPLPATAGFFTQSPDKRWLLFGDSDNTANFTEYDLSNPAKPQALALSLPAGSYTPGDGAQSWTPTEWASDNKHVLLLHTFVSNKVPRHEYVMLDRSAPVNSVNVTTQLNLDASITLSLYNKRPTQFYAYNPTDQSLATTSTDDSLTPTRYEHVLAYKTYGNGDVLYVTDQSPDGKPEAAGTVSVVLQMGDKTTLLRTLPVGGTYSLNMAQYSGDWYVAAAASNDTSVYIYKNPQSQALSSSDDTYPDPWRRMTITHPDYLAFSANTQFLMAEGGQDFGVYDAENDNMYDYVATPPLDQPQTHASWMDGDRITYVSGGKLVVFDYDYRNQQTLQAADPDFLPAFAPDYSYIYVMAPASATNKPALTSTSLVVKS